MVKISDIKDEGGLKDWLETQPPEVAAWIAERCTLRVLPFYWDWMATSADAQKLEGLTQIT